MINKERLLTRFLKYVSCGSESLHEKEFCLLLEEELSRIGVPFVRDLKAGQAAGSDGWNLQCFLPGEGDPILLSAHMDTVAPGNGIVPVVEDGVVRSAADTVLGSDDKSGVAAIMEALETVVEEGRPHRPVEVLFSICEEKGLLGSQNADYSRYQSRQAVVMDSSKNGKIVIRSTDNATLRVRILGKSSHAANAPEDGVNALKAACRAIDRIPCGKPDEDTVLNVGALSAPAKANIVPDLVEFTIMLRSFSTERQQYWLKTLEETIRDACEDFGAQYEIQVKKNYQGLKASPDLPIVRRLQEIYHRLGADRELGSTFGGSDATWIAAQGIEVVNLGTGMSNIHGVDEFIRVEDLELTGQAAYMLMQP
ncbi:MAG: M20/M25/M40 family metallo-hydrolase [Lachnospiraceae bacterium]|nr:M20/M25/M40 family metallo-hydrolase [Lachnospiraceae bacterium]